MLDAIGALGSACRRTATRRSSRRPTAARQSARLRRAAARRSARRTTGRLHQPGRLSRRRRRLPAPARRPRRDARRRAAAPRRRALGAGRLRHARQPAAGRSRDGLKLTADSLLAFQRDLEARGLADRVLVHVWSEFGRRAKENGSRGTDHGAAGIGFLIGIARRPATMIGEFPGLATARRATATCARRPTSAGSTRALLEQWLGADAEAIIPGARKFARPEDCDQVIATRARPAHARGACRRPGVQVVGRRVRLHALARHDQAGPAIVELVNYGEDDHDLAPAPGRRDEGLPDRHASLPAASAELEARFRPGRFRLWCTLADHRARGMRATLLVKKS